MFTWCTEYLHSVLVLVKVLSLSLCPPGGVSCQAEESADRGGPSLVPGSLQPAQPAAEGKAEGAGECTDSCW